MDGQDQATLKPKSKAWIYILVVLVLAMVAGVVWCFVKYRVNTTNNITQEPSNVSEVVKDDPPLLIKNMPINFAPYDPATEMAGDFKFTKANLQFDALYMDYGFLIPASPDNPVKRNPQPTFLAPLGTKVRSLVDGEVIEIGKLYSDDYSIAVSINKNSPYRYETEHVINPIVKVGDRVKAGDVIAQVSNFSSGAEQLGLGMVEIGILKGGKSPTHICPFRYLDPTVKDKITNDLKTLYNDWNTYKGKSIYNLADYKTIGCLVEEDIEDNNNSATGNAAR